MPLYVGVFAGKQGKQVVVRFIFGTVYKTAFDAVRVLAVAELVEYEMVGVVYDSLEKAISCLVRLFAEQELNQTTDEGQTWYKGIYHDSGQMTHSGPFDKVVLFAIEASRRKAPLWEKNAQVLGVQIAKALQ